MKKHPKYLAYIREQYCSVDGCLQMAVPHHCSAGGMGTKCSDFETIPLCTKHHRELHDKGKITFQRNHPECGYVGLKLLANWMEENYGKFERE